MKQQTILNSTESPGVLWVPEGPCRLVMQVVHGMTEHIGRYEAFAERMTEAGIAVAGFDLPGHGKNPGDPVCASLGREGWRETLDKIALVNRELRAAFPGIPLVLLGFSLGSFLVRDYLGNRRDEISAAIVMGSGDQPGPVLRLLKALVSTQIRKAGFDGTTALVQNLSFGAYNRGFRPNRTQADWLCSDQKELDAYLSDPLCRQQISAGLFWQLLDGMERTGKDAAAGWNPKMPVLLLSGAQDPVGNGGRGVASLEKKLRAGGMERVERKLIPGARHDVLHEKSSGGADLAAAEILRFLS